MKTTNILISGASSFIGEKLIEILLNDSSNRIFALVRPKSASNSILDKFKGRISIIELDMIDYSNLSDVLDSNIDVLYHLSWSGTRSINRLDEKLQYSNYINSINLLNEAVKLGVKKIISVGSQAEYGICFDKVDELHKTLPNTAYGKYKLKLLEYIQRELGNKTQYIWFRLFSSYGVGDFKNTLIMYCIDNMIKNCDVNLSSCKQQWNYINVADVVKVLSLAIDYGFDSGVYNLSSNDTRKLKFFVEEIKKITHSKSTINYSNDSDKNIVNLDPDNTKLRKQINFEFKQFSDGIIELLQHLQK